MSRYSNSYFSKTIGTIPPTKISMKNFPFAEYNSFNNVFFSDPCIGFVSVQIFQRFPFFLFRSIFKLVILSHYKFNILHQNFKRKHSTCRRVLDQKIVIFIPCIRIVIVRKLRRKLFNFIFSRFSTFNIIFHQNDRLYIFHQGRHENFLVVENFSRGGFLVCVPCISILAIRNFQKVPLLFISLNFQACIPQRSQVRIPPPRTQSRTKHLHSKSGVKTYNSLHWIRIQIVQKFQKTS